MEGLLQSVDKSIQLGYRVFGNGDEVIFAFHGFGHSANEMEWLSGHISASFRLIAIDVPGHGNSKIFHEKRKNSVISKEEWKALIEIIMAQFSVGSFHLIGYSLGGRMAMVTAEMFPSRIQSLYLFSPDGLHKTLMYRFANETSLGNHILKSVLASPRVAIRIIETLGKLRLIPSRKAKFVRYQLENPDRAGKVHTVWTSLSHCWPDTERLFDEVASPDHVVVTFGTYDPIILPKYSNYVKPYARKNFFVEMAPLGHRTLKKEGIELLKQRGIWLFS